MYIIPKLHRYLFFILFWPCFLSSKRLTELSKSERYAIALIDAKTPGIWEKSRSLISVTPWNNYIIWDNIKFDERKKILVASYIELQHLKFFLNEYAKKEILEATGDTDIVLKTENGTVKLIFSKNDLQAIKDFFGIIDNKVFNDNFPYKHDSQFRNDTDVSWVTIVPEVQFALYKYGIEHLGKKRILTTLAKSVPNKSDSDKPIFYKSLDLQLRSYLNQKLGLYPDNICWQGDGPKYDSTKCIPQSKFLVVMEADPNNLYRPTIDQTIYNSESFPEEATKQDYVAHGIKNDVFEPLVITDKKAYTKDGDPRKYNDWYKGLKEKQYDNVKMPWTRLGYTYDWSKEAFNRDLKNKERKQHVFNCGFSEFCIKPRDNVKDSTKIVAIYSLSKYSSSDINAEYKQIIRNQFNACVKELLNYMKNNDGNLEQQIATKIQARKSLLGILQEDRNHRGNMEENSVEKYSDELDTVENEICDLLKQIAKDEKLKNKYLLK